MSPVRPWSSTAEWSLASLGSVTSTLWQSATITCSRASSSQRHSSKCYFLTASEKTIKDIGSNIGSNTECWWFICTYYLLCEWDTDSPLPCSWSHLRWFQSHFECDVLHSLVKETWMANRWCAVRRLNFTSRHSWFIKQRKLFEVPR